MVQGDWWARGTPVMPDEGTQVPDESITVSKLDPAVFVALGGRAKSGTPANAMAASVVLEGDGANSDLAVTALIAGVDGEGITIALEDPGLSDMPLEVHTDLDTRAIVVSLETDSDPATATIGEGTHAVAITTVVHGDAGNAYAVTVIEGTEADQPMTAALTGEDDLDLVVTLGLDHGTGSSAEIGSGPGGTVMTTLQAGGTFGDAYSIAVVEGSEPDGALGAALTGEDDLAVVVTLGMDAGVQSYIDIGDPGGVVRVIVDVPGESGDAYTIAVVENTENPTQTLQAAFSDEEQRDIVVTLANDGGLQAYADIGSTGHVVRVIRDEQGVTGNGYFVAIVVAESGAQPLSAALDGLTITLTLGTETDGDSDNAKNTAPLVQAALDALEGFHASTSDTGFFSDADVTDDPIAFDNGQDFATDDAQNGASAARDVIDALDGVHATTSDTDPVVLKPASHFAHGVDIAPADAMNHADDVALVIAALGGGTLFTSTANGTDPLTGAEGPTMFADGADPALDPSKNGADDIALAIAALGGGEIFRAVESGTDPLTEAQEQIGFANGGEHPVVMTTAAEVETLLNEDTDASSLVSVSADGDGSGLVLDSDGPVSLANGVDGTIGTQGALYQDETYLYVCRGPQTVADANWRRVALGSAY